MISRTTSGRCRAGPASNPLLSVHLMHAHKKQSKIVTLVTVSLHRFWHVCQRQTVSLRQATSPSDLNLRHSPALPRSVARYPNPRDTGPFLNSHQALAMRAENARRLKSRRVILGFAKKSGNLLFQTESLIESVHGCSVREEAPLYFSGEIVPRKDDRSAQTPQNTLFSRHPVRVPILAAVLHLRPRSPRVRGPCQGHTGFSKITLFRPWPQCNAGYELCTPLVVFGSLYSFIIAKHRNPARRART